VNTKKIIQEYGFSNFPIGLGGCKISEHFFDSCTFDIVVFDEKQDSEIITFENELIKISHASLSEKN